MADEISAAPSAGAVSALTTLERKIARRADKLTQHGINVSKLNLLCWLVAEAELDAARRAVEAESRRLAGAIPPTEPTPE